MATKKRQYRSVFLSDIHLGFRDCRSDYLLDFLNHLECDTLYLIGDIIDLRAMSRQLHWPSSHYQVIKKIVALSEAGTRVVYIPGNHDEPVREYVGQMFGAIEILQESAHVTADGRELLLIHGDCLDDDIRLSRIADLLGDVVYDLVLFLNRMATRVRRLFGLPYWSLASYIKEHSGKAREVIDSYEKAAANLARERGFDGVVCGHIHKPEIRMLDGILYCNDGDWIENCSALTEDASGHLHILRWTERALALKVYDGVISSVPREQDDLKKIA